MNRTELIATLKRNNHVAFDLVNEDDIRMAIVFRPYGFFCGYIGIPREIELYNSSKDEIYEMFSGICNGGITYDDYETPTDIKADKDRRWIGFDCGHSCNGNDIELVTEIYGTKEALIASAVSGYGDFVSYEEVLKQIYSMILVISVQSTMSSAKDIIRHEVMSSCISVLTKFVDTDGLMTEKGKRVVTELIKELN